MTDTVTLKPCPFCGGKATLIEGYWSSGSWYWPDVVCNDRKCGASKQAVDHDFCKKEAIASWNTRVQPDSALVEELPVPHQLALNQGTMEIVREVFPHKAKEIS